MLTTKNSIHLPAILNKIMQNEVAKILLETNAVKLSPDNPFTWSSGWKSPIYCDNRTLLSFPAERDLVKKSLASAIAEKYPQADVIIGVATAGIAIGALVADEMGLSYAYCRPKPKEHGLKKQLEGRVAEGSKIVVMEDLISTGGSSLKVVEFLRSEGFEVVGLAAIFSYGFAIADQNFEEANCEKLVLSDYNQLLGQATSSGYINSNQIEALEEWRRAPQDWG
ncbi:MAG: orotate phosphoribosyltransferase [Bacteroidia bacterium]